MSLTSKRELLNFFETVLAPSQLALVTAMSESKAGIHVTNPEAVLAAIAERMRDKPTGKRVFVFPDEDLVDLLSFVGDTSLQADPMLGDAFAGAYRQAPYGVTWKLRRQLQQAGRLDLAEEFGFKPSFADGSIDTDWLDKSWQRFLTLLSGLSNSRSLTYVQERRLEEIGDLLETLCISSSPASSLAEAFIRNEGELTQLVELIIELGGFDVHTIAAQAAFVLTFDNTSERSLGLLLDGGRQRSLARWNDLDSKIAHLRRLLRATEWIASLAVGAMRQCPARTKVASAIENDLDCLKPINKLIAGDMLIDLDVNMEDSATKLALSSDPFDRQIAAWWFGSKGNDARVVGHCLRLSSDSDRGVKDALIEGLERVDLAIQVPEQLGLQIRRVAEERDLLGAFACRWCGFVNTEGERSCKKCDTTGPDPKARAKRWLERSDAQEGPRKFEKTRTVMIPTN